MSNVVELLLILLDEIKPLKNIKSDDWNLIINSVKNNLHNSKNFIYSSPDPLIEAFSTLLNSYLSNKYGLPGSNLYNALTLGRVLRENVNINQNIEQNVINDDDKKKNIFNTIKRLFNKDVENEVNERRYYRDPYKLRSGSSKGGSELISSNTNTNENNNTTTTNENSTTGNSNENSTTGNSNENSTTGNSNGIEVNLDIEDNLDITNNNTILIEDAGTTSTTVVPGTTVIKDTNTTNTNTTNTNTTNPTGTTSTNTNTNPLTTTNTTTNPLTNNTLTTNSGESSTNSEENSNKVAAVTNFGESSNNTNNMVSSTKEPRFGVGGSETVMKNIYIPLNNIMNEMKNINLYVVALEMIRASVRNVNNQRDVFNYRAIDPSVFNTNGIDYSIQIITSNVKQQHHINFGDILRLKRVDAYTVIDKFGKKHINIIMSIKNFPTMRLWHSNLYNSSVTVSGPTETTHTTTNTTHTTTNTHTTTTTTTTTTTNKDTNGTNTNNANSTNGPIGVKVPLGTRFESQSSNPTTNGTTNMSIKDGEGVDLGDGLDTVTEVINIYGGIKINITNEDNRIIEFLKNWSKKLNPNQLLTSEYLKKLSEASENPYDFIVKILSVWINENTILVTDNINKAIVCNFDPILISNLFNSFNPLQRGDWIKLRSFVRIFNDNKIITLTTTKYSCVTRLPIQFFHNHQDNNLIRERRVNLDVWSRTSCLNNSFPKRFKRSPTFIQKLLSTQPIVTFQKASPSKIITEREEETSTTSTHITVTGTTDSTNTNTTTTNTHTNTTTTNTHTNTTTTNTHTYTNTLTTTNSTTNNNTNTANSTNSTNGVTGIKGPLGTRFESQSSNPTTTNNPLTSSTTKDTGTVVLDTVTEENSTIQIAAPTLPTQLLNYLTT